MLKKSLRRDNMAFKYPIRPIDTMYHVVKMPITNNFKWDDIFDYLTENFGISGVKWDILVTSVWNIHFESKEDANKFYAVANRFYLTGFDHFIAWVIPSTNHMTTISEE